MNASGPLLVTPVRPTADQDLVLRPFQRVTAQVLQVTSTQAILSLEGYHVVARLTSAEQAAALLADRTARFIVTQLTEEGMILRLLRPEQAAVESGGVESASRRDLATRLVEHTGLPVTPGSLSLVRALLNQRLPVTAELVQEMNTVLSGLGDWGDTEAGLAAAVKAAGLPLTPASLALASRPAVQVGEALAGLVATLRAAAGRKNLPPEMAQAVQGAIDLLEETLLEWGPRSGRMAAQLENAARFTGRSLENVLAEQVASKNPFWPEKTLLALVRLRQFCQYHQDEDLTGAIDRLLEEARAGQFLNLRSDPVPGRGEWGELALLLQSPVKENAPITPARLRVYRPPEKRDSAIDPQYTRLTIQVDVEPGLTVEVDLALVSRQVRALVTVPGQAWQREAQSELPNLQDALDALGYSLAGAAVEVGPASPFGILPVHYEGAGQLEAIDVEV